MMDVSALIVRAYPPPVRDRWGCAIREELAEGGLRAWPDTAAEAAKLWVHPSDWPEHTVGQTRHVVTVALVVIAAVTAVLLRASSEAFAAVAPRAGDPATAAWIALVAAGLLLALPRLTLPIAAPRALLIVAARVLAGPATLLLAMYLVANSGVVDRQSWPLHASLVAWYWATLTLAAIRVCTLASRLTPLARAPGRRRLQFSLVLVAAGLTIAAGAIATRTILTPQTIAATACLTVIAAAAVTAATDLRRRAL